MSSTTRGSRPLVAAFLVSVLSSWIATPSWAATVENLGFEDDCLGLGCAWQASGDPSAPEYIDIVGSEGPGDFSVYDRENVQVDPFRGDNMLRLGLPQRGNEQAVRATFAVEQSFTPATGTLSFVMYFASYEHRGDDQYAIRVLGSNVGGVQFFDENDQPFGLDMPDGSTAMCQGGPGSCELTVNTGRSNRFLNSGWRRVRITGLPVGEAVTLRYELTNGQNNATGSWLYADDFNQPPVAEFSCAPTNINQEGDLTFCDARDSNDPDGDLLTYTWTYSGGGYDTPRTAEGPIFAAIFPEDGSAFVNLQVSDGSFEDTAETTIAVTNHVPLVGAIDIYARPGDTVEAQCRFIDYGAYDGVLDPELTFAHRFDFTIGSIMSEREDLVQTQENDPALATGTAAFSFTIDPTTPSETIIDGTCDVYDGAATGTAGFKVHVDALTDADWAAREAADEGATEGTTPWTAGASRLVRIDEPVDGVEDLGDAFLLQRNDGTPLQGGDQVLLRLTEPANGKDLDLILAFGFPDGYVDFPAQDLPAQDLAWKTAPAQDLPAQDLPAQDLPAQDLPAQDLPAQDLTFMSTVYESLPAQDLAFADLSFLASPAQDLGVTFNTSPIALLGLAYYEYPLDSVADFEYNVASNAHLNFSETGGLSIEYDPTVVAPMAMSANAVGDDVIWFPIPDGVQQVYALVVPSEPAGLGEPPITTMLSYEASERPPSSRRLPPPLCLVPQVADPTNATGTELEPLSDYGVGADGNTVVFLQKERMIATWFADEADPEGAFETFMGILDANYFKHPNVRAEVYSLPLSLWKVLNPDEPRLQDVCDIEARLTLIESMRQLILGAIREPGTVDEPRGGLEHAVLLGDADSIDWAIVKDLAVVGNERNYRYDVGLKVNSPNSITLAEGYLGTDNCWTDFQRQVVAGQPYCTPDLPVARWSGKHDVVAQEAITFALNNGVLPTATALAMGYDFFSQSTADALTASRIDTAFSTCITDQDIDGCVQEVWNGDRLREEFLGQCEDCEVPSFNIINGHAAHWALVPPAEFFSKDYSTILKAEELQNLLDGRTVVSLGCHFRYSAPATEQETGGGLFEAREDFCDQAGPIIGQSVYGIGDTEFSDKLTELIMQQTVGHLADGLTLAQASRRAIIDYGLVNVPFTEHDHHVSMGWGVDGPPQWRLDDASGLLIQALLGVGSPPAGTCTGDGTLDLETIETDEVDSHVSNVTGVGVERCNIADRGDYWAYNGSSQGTQLLPQLPTLTTIDGQNIDDHAISGTHIHAATLLSGTFYDYVENPTLDPVFDANVTDWALSALEAQPCIKAQVPVQPGVVKSLDTAGDTFQTFTFVGGAFQCTETEVVDGREQARGVMRIFDSASIKLHHPSADLNYQSEGLGDEFLRDDDFFSPNFTKLEFSRDAATGEIYVDMLAEDPSGIDEYRVLIFHSLPGGGAGEVFNVSTKDDPTLDTPLMGEQRLVLPDPSAAEAMGFDVRFAAIAVDGAGNHNGKFRKGTKFVAPIPVSVTTQFYNTAGLTTIVTVVSGYDQLTNPMLNLFVNNEPAGMADLADGTPGVVCLEGGFTGPDPCTVVQYTTDIDLSGDTPPIVIRAEVSDDANAFGFDEVTLSECTDEDSLVPDAADFRGCNASINGTVVTIDLITEAGTDPDYQYRFIFDGLPGAPQFKIWNIDGRGRTKTSSPTGADPIVFEKDGDNVVRLTVDLAPLGGQPGVIPEFSGKVQSGVEQEPGQGFLDIITPFLL